MNEMIQRLESKLAAAKELKAVLDKIKADMTAAGIEDAEAELQDMLDSRGNE